MKEQFRKFSESIDVFTTLLSWFKAAVTIWQESEDLDGIIGPMCSSVCQDVALLTAAWNLPTISYTCGSDVFSNVVTYPTFP